MAFLATRKTLRPLLALLLCAYLGASLSAYGRLVPTLHGKDICITLDICTPANPAASDSDEMGLAALPSLKPALLWPRASGVIQAIDSFHPKVLYLSPDPPVPRNVA